MNEIKFRAWDKKKKVMFNGIFVGCGKVFSMTKTCKPKKLLNALDLEIMQYTGLKDINEKEIFSGDIVRINNKKYLIVYELGAFCLVRISEKIDMYEEFENCWNDDVYPLIQFWWDSMSTEDYVNNLTIIGSKFENPELLEEK